MDPYTYKISNQCESGKETQCRFVAGCRKHCSGFVKFYTTISINSQNIFYLYLLALLYLTRCTFGGKKPNKSLSPFNSMICHYHRCPCFSSSIFHGSFRPNPNPNPSSFTLHRSPPSSLKPLISTQISATSSEEISSIIETLNPSNPRRQNAKSTSLFLLHSQGSAPLNDDQEVELDEDELQRKRIVEEASLATRRIARFPGSVDFPKPEQFQYPIDLNRAVLESDEEEIRKAIEVRRGVAAEILKGALRAGKFSVNYSENLVSRLSGFIDRVVIGAAAMKAVSEFNHVSFNARAKSCIQSSGVVALVKWLKHNSMTYPQIGKAICMCSGDLEQVRRVAEWLKTIHVKGRSLGVVLVKASSILERSLEEMDQIVDYLIETGVRRDWVGFVVTRCPQVLTLTMEELVSRVKFYSEMGMNKEDFGTMVFDYPRVLGFFSLDEMNTKVFAFR